MPSLSSQYGPSDLEIRDLVAQTGLSRSKIYRLIRAGIFPPPVRKLCGRNWWGSCEIRVWRDGHWKGRAAR